MGLDDRGHVVVDGQEQLVLAAEVVVDAADTGPGSEDDLADRGGAVAAFTKNGGRGAQYALLGRIRLLPAPPGLRHQPTAPAASPVIIPRP